MANRSTGPRTLMLLLALAALYGCSFGRKAEPVETYVLESGDVATPSTTATASILKVSTPTSVPEFATSRMAYVEQPYRVDYFAQHAWADTPAHMLKPLLTRQLTNCGLFHYAFSESTGVDETLRLDSSIVEFAQWFSEEASEVRVSIRFDLIDVVHRTMLDQPDDFGHGSRVGARAVRRRRRDESSGPARARSAGDATARSGDRTRWASIRHLEASRANQCGLFASTMTCFAIVPYVSGSRSQLTQSANSIPLHQTRS